MSRVIELFGTVDDLTSFIAHELIELDQECNAPIVLLISSSGGDEIIAAGICGIIESIASPVWSVITGEAASCASDISACCDYRYMLYDARMLIHDVTWKRRRGRPNTIEKKNKELQRKIDIKRYMKWTGLSRTKAKNLLDGEWLLDANGCLSLGFVDEIIYDKGRLSTILSCAKRNGKRPLGVKK